MICSNCKNEIEEGNLFCNYCGHKFQKENLFCPSCGSELKQGTAFCPACGIKVVTSSKENKDRKKLPLSTIIVSLLAIILALGMAFVLIYKGVASSDQKYFKTPETAAEYFVKCINKNDFEGALQAFALDEKAKNYDSVAFMERMNAFMPLTGLAPEYKEYAPLNRAFLNNQASQSVKGFAYSFIYKEDFTIPLILSDSNYEASDIYKLLDPVKLKGLKLDRLDYVYPELQDSERNQENIKAMGETFGFTDKKEYFALYEFEDEFFVGGFSLVKYKKGWQIDALNSPLGGTAVYAVTPTNEDEYESMLEE